MDPERWSRVEQLFHAVRELPDDEQRSVLENRAGEDPEIVQEVLSLLSHRSAGFMEGCGHLDDLHARDRTDNRPDRVRHYKILDTLGEGGMGVVHLAEQEQPVRRKVALKLIKRGMDTRQVVARFESERQALALMNHPNIARVYDGGSTEGGLPYFVMEYVVGVPITEHCDAHRLGSRERLELFVEVCHGVQHAHQKGIIHRDLKASNVLVATEDDRSVPKIIDFGIAKATDLRLTEGTVFTELGQIIGTPEYMSPEQAELSGQDVDTRTDVYSLGVLLYELLVGRLPFEPDELRRAGFDELRRMIREVDPPRPSTRFADLGEDSRTLWSERQTSPGELVRALRGDLDWITMKALAKDRSRRYSSASELAADIRRHVAHEPVLARPPGAGYRVSKFVRRHRVGVAASALVLLALLAGISGTTVGLVRALRAEQVAEDEARRANREAEVSGSVSRYLEGIFEDTDPNKARGEALTAEELLDLGVTQMADLEQEPEVRGRLLGSLGKAYRRLGIYEKAYPLLREALPLRRQTLGADHEDLVHVLNELGGTAREMDRNDEARGYYEEALAVAERVHGPDDPDVASILTNLGAAQVKLGKLDSARVALERSLSIREREFGEESAEVARSLVGFGNLFLRAGDPESALPFFRRSLELREKTLPPGDRGLGYGHYFLGLALLESGEFGEARAHLSEALQIWQSMHGENQEEVIQCVFDLARAAQGTGDLEQADGLYRRAIREEGERHGIDHEYMIERYDGYAAFLRDTGRDEQAREYESRSAEIRERSGPS